MRSNEMASPFSAYRLFNAYLHTHPRRRFPRPEPKSDLDRTNLGLPLREPWFEVKPFDEKKMRFVLSLKDTLQAQPKQKIELIKLSQLRRELDVHRQGKQRKMATYVRRFPGAFTLQSFFTPNDTKKQLCSFSSDALKLLAEEERILEACEASFVQTLCKILMISMKNRLPLETVDKVRRCLGFPVDYKESLVKRYPDIFLLKERKGFLYIELKEWDEALAISVLKKNIQEGKYKMKKQKGERQKNEANDEEAICEMDDEEEEISFKENDNEVSLVERRKCQGGGIKSLNHDSIDKVHDQMIAQTKEGGLNQHRSPECNHQLHPLPVGHMMDWESDVESESHQEDGVAFQLNNIRQNKPTNPGGALKAEAFNLSESNGRNAPTEALSVMKKDDYELASLVETNKDSEVEVTCSFDGDEAREGEKQFECSVAVCENLTCLPFPWVLKKGRRPRINRAAVIESFQALPYVSPYKNSRELVFPLPDRLQTDKFVVGLIHEFLSLTLEKRATVQQLELFRRPYRLPVNLLDFLLKYDGIFYVTRGTTKPHVFLKEAYKEFDLREKEPLLLWRERFVELAFSAPKFKEGKLKK